MRNRAVTTPHQPSHHKRSWGRALLSAMGFVFLAACGDDSAGPEARPSYTITAGACGKLVFHENLGADSASAIQKFEARTTTKYGAGRFTLEPQLLEVVDRHGNVPEPRFYALQLINHETGAIEYSPVDVITTGGDLFRLVWCLD